MQTKKFWGILAATVRKCKTIHSNGPELNCYHAALLCNDQKTKFSFSDYQKSERDFAFIVNKDVNAQDLINAVSSVDRDLVSNIKVFDVYEGDNIPENQKSIAISVTIQSSEKTLNETDLEKINNSIIQSVENKTGAKIRS